MLKNQRYRDDYAGFMKNLIDHVDHSYAERVPDNEIERCDGSVCGYIPHHGVYNPHKPGKIRVIFDCSAEPKQTPPSRT
jgi:hypothetical protein